MKTERGSEDLTRAAYDTVAADYARSMRGTSQEHFLDLAMIEFFLHGVGGGRILDAGAGTGRITGYAAQRGADIRGVDLSPRMVEEARRLFPDLSFDVGSLLELPYPDDAFAGVLLWYSVIHLTDTELERALAEVARVARPGGLMLLASQSGDQQIDLRQVYARMGHDLHLTRQSREADTLVAAVKRAGGIELARLVRRGEMTGEMDDHAVILARFA